MTLGLHIPHVRNNADVRTIDFFVQRDQRVAIAANQVGLHLHTVNQACRRALLHNLPELLRRPVQVCPRILSVRMVVTEPPEQFGVERVGEIDCPLHVVFQIGLKRDVPILCPVVLIHELDLAQRRTHAGYADPERAVKILKPLHFLV